MTDDAVPNSKTALTDDIRDAFSGDAPITEKAKNFAKARPVTTATFLGLAAMMVLNGLRGVRK